LSERFVPHKPARPEKAADQRLDRTFDSWHGQLCKMGSCGQMPAGTSAFATFALAGRLWLVPYPNRSRQYYEASFFLNCDCARDVVCHARRGAIERYRADRRFGQIPARLAAWQPVGGPRPQRAGKAQQDLVSASAEVVNAQNRRDSSQQRSSNAAQEYRRLTATTPPQTNSREALRWAEDVQKAAENWSRFDARSNGGSRDLDKSMNAQRKAQEAIDKAQAKVARGREAKSEAERLSAASGS
jgi:hypothetical protein